jgi:hypothetical protein
MNRFCSTASIALAIMATLGPVGSVSAGENVPFHGRLQGDVTRTLEPPLVLVHVDAAGNGTHLGRFTLEIPHVVDLATRVAVGTYQFTAANGDTIYAEFTGLATPTEDPGVLYIEETATITGGTGRFAGVTGSFVAERLYDTVAGTTIGSFDGTISKAGS